MNEAQCRLFTVHYCEVSGTAVGCRSLLAAERGHAQCMGPTLAQSVIPCGRSRGEGSCASCWSRQEILRITLSAVHLRHQQTTFTRLSFSRVPKDWLGRRLVIDVDRFRGDDRRQHPGTKPPSSILAATVVRNFPQPNTALTETVVGAWSSPTNTAYLGPRIDTHIQPQ